MSIFERQSSLSEGWAVWWNKIETREDAIPVVIKATRNLAKQALHANASALADSTSSLGFRRRINLQELIKYGEILSTRAGFQNHKTWVHPDLKQDCREHCGRRKMPDTMNSEESLFRRDLGHRCSPFASMAAYRLQ